PRAPRLIVRPHARNYRRDGPESARGGFQPKADPTPIATAPPPPAAWPAHEIRRRIPPPAHGPSNPDAPWSKRSPVVPPAVSLARSHSTSGRRYRTTNVRTESAPKSSTSWCTPGRRRHERPPPRDRTAHAHS